MKNNSESTVSTYIIREIKKLHLGKKPTILDVGCGVGQYFKYMKGQITGIDFDDSNIKAAKKKFPKAKLIKYDVSRLPLPIKDKYDLILCLEVIEHMPKSKAKALLKELENKTSGHLIISTPNVNNFTSFLRFVMFGQLSIAGTPNRVEKIIYLIKNKKRAKKTDKYFVMNENDVYSNANLHYHVSNFSSYELQKMGYRVIGGLGFVVERKISNKYIKKVFDLFYRYFPYFSGSIVGIKDINEV